MKTLLSIVFLFIQYISYSQEKDTKEINDQGLDYSIPHYHEKYLLDKTNETIYFISFFGDSILQDSSKVYFMHDNHWVFDNKQGHKEIGMFENYKISFFKRKVSIEVNGKMYVLMKKVGKWQYFYKDALIREELE